MSAELKNFYACVMVQYKALRDLLRLAKGDFLPLENSSDFVEGYLLIEETEKVFLTSTEKAMCQAILDLPLSKSQAAALGLSHRNVKLAITVPAQPFRAALQETLVMLDTTFLPRFLRSKSFADFLQQARLHKGNEWCALNTFILIETDRYALPFVQKFQGGKDCLFGKAWISKKEGKEEDAQGQKRLSNESDEYMDSGFIHGGRQRVKVSAVYPLLLNRCVRSLKKSKVREVTGTS